MPTPIVSPPASQKAAAVDARRLWWAGPVAAVASVIANLLMRALLVPLFNPPAEFTPLTPPPITLFTLGGTLAAAMVYAVVARLSARPTRAFVIVAGVALIVSILPDLALMANPAAAPFPGGSALTFGLLIVFHVVAALVCVTLLTALTRKKA